MVIREAGISISIQPILEGIRNLESGLVNFPYGAGINRSKKKANKPIKTQ